MLGTLSNYFYFTVNFHSRNTSLTSVSTLLSTFLKSFTLEVQLWEDIILIYIEHS